MMRSTGSMNSLLHLPANAYELNINIMGADFYRIHINTPYILNMILNDFYLAE